jgi:uncharacterized protein (DUF2384 family)
MVFGIGEGKIDIILDRTSYSLGDTINGKAVLTLNSPKKAKELRLRFWEERTVRRNVTSHGAQGTSTRSANANEMIYEMKLTLEGEKEYTGGEYQFQVKIPGLQEKQPNDLVGGNAEGVKTAIETVANIAQEFGVAPAPVRWYIQVSLDLPMSLDINKKVQINVV